MTLALDTTTRKARKLVLYGDYGTGKTQTAATFPKPLVAQDSQHRGADDLCKKTSYPKVTLSVFEDFLQLPAFMRTQKDVQTLVLDDFNLSMARWIDPFVKAQGDELRGNKNFNDKFLPAFQELLMLPINLIITAHARNDVEIDIDSGKTRPLKYPDFPPALRKYICGMVAAVIYTFPKANEMWGLTVDKVVPKGHITAKQATHMALPEQVLLKRLAAEVLK